MEPSKVKVPKLKDLTIDNITENVVRINSQGSNPRLTYILERLVHHLHDFARETRLSSQEWMNGIQFLTQTGQICSDVRQEFILLSDILGLSMLVDNMDHPKPPGATEGTVLGPFHTHEAQEMAHGDSMSHDPNGQPTVVICTIKDLQGNPLPDVKIDIWETDSTGHYDVQMPDREGPDGRCVMRSDKEGKFHFRAIKPVEYPIPHDGSVGKLLQILGRHPYRPSHLHFMFEKPGWDHLITALYLRGDPYETSDAVFGVKESLLVEYLVADEVTCKQYNLEPGSLVLRHDFILVSEKESSDLRTERSRKALEGLGKRVRFLNGLPVPDVD